MTTAAKRSHPFREKMFQRAVRFRLVSELVRGEGFTRAEAREAVDELEDGVIEQAAVAVSGAEPPAVGAGGFLQFLLQFLSSDMFTQLIEMLLGLFGGKTASRAAPPAPAPQPAPEPPPA